MAEVTTSRATAQKIQAGDPEYTISLVGLVTSLAGQPVVGLILSAIALRQSKRARRSNTLALLGLIFGIIFTCLGMIMVLLYTTLILVTTAAHGSGTF